MSSSSFHTITAALPYANGPIHIGHLAGVYIPADIYARYRRSRGEQVLFISGSDEHGVPITIRAQQEGVTPQQVVDKYHVLNERAFSDLGMSFDIFSRTSSSTHRGVAQDFFKRLHDQGDLIQQEEEQYYDAEHNQFLADRYVQGTCPTCGYVDAYGDQCERCGRTLSPEELLSPRSALSGAELQRKKTEHWYLPLDRYEGWLKEWILEGHPEWRANVYGQCQSWLSQGLQPRAITRDLSWGVPVPLPGAEDKVLYVWFDAPIGYISAAQEWAASSGQDWRPFWEGENAELVHFVGKDNIVFHCIIFPAMLKAHGDFVLPKNVPANEFMNLEGRKISTSRNWAVWLHEYLEDFPGQQDVLRYVLCANAPESKDGDFSWQDFQAKNNNELVAILGNFVNRTLVLVHKYFQGVVPAVGELTDREVALMEYVRSTPARVGDSIERFKFREALQQVMELARAGNKYLADTEPWHLMKSNPERVATILNVSLQLTANLAILLEPFLPFTSEKLCQWLGGDVGAWDRAGSMELVATGAVIERPTLLFEKVLDSTVAAQQDKLRRP